MKIDVVAILAALLPYLKKILDEKLIPYLKQRIYIKLNNAIEKCVKGLYALYKKILGCEDETKKQIHIKCFKLGIEFLKQAGKTLTEAHLQLQKMIESVEK